MRKKIQTESWIYVCDFCEGENPQRAIGSCLQCSKQVCKEHSLCIEVTPEPEFNSFRVHYSLSHDYTYLCPTCQNIQMTLKDFIQKYGASKGSITTETIAPM